MRLVKCQLFLIGSHRRCGKGIQQPQNFRPPTERADCQFANHELMDDHLVVEQVGDQPALGGSE
jgi:hypothetical protein